MNFLQAIQIWHKQRQTKQMAISCAIQQFCATHPDYVPQRLSGFVLHVDQQKTIVRLMYITSHVPPERAWFAVSHTDHKVHELTWDNVKAYEISPWR